MAVPCAVWKTPLVFLYPEVPPIHKAFVLQIGARGGISLGGGPNCTRFRIYTAMKFTLLVGKGPCLVCCCPRVCSDRGWEGDGGESMPSSGFLDFNLTEFAFLITHPRYLLHILPRETLRAKASGARMRGRCHPEGERPEGGGHWVLRWSRFLILQTWGDGIPLFIGSGSLPA